MAVHEPEPLFDAAFAGTVIEWRGPAPFLFVPVPAAHVDELRLAARLASYGWGVVPVKVAVQRAAGVEIGTLVTVRITVQG